MRELTRESTAAATPSSPVDRSVVGACWPRFLSQNSEKNRGFPFAHAPGDSETLSVKASRSKDIEGLWEWNLVTNRIHFSPRWLALIGCADQEACHTPEVWLDRVHPEDLGDLLIKIETVRADGGEFQSRHRLRHQDGLYRWMACRGPAVNEHGPAGRPKGGARGGSVGRE